MQDRLRAQRGPASDIHRATGPFSFTEIRCQVIRRDGPCDRRLAVVDGEAEPRGWTVESLEQVGPGEHGAYCTRCSRVTVYSVREAV